MKVTVIGRMYSDEATYPTWDADKAFPHYALVEEQTWEIEAATLRDGEKWLAHNHPAYYMGANIICENGDFAMLAVPCCEYGKGNYETLAARIACVRREFPQDRLTSWNGEKWILPQGRTSDGRSYWRLIAERLAAYENTGLTPEQIEAMKGDRA